MQDVVDEAVGSTEETQEIPMTKYNQNYSIKNKFYHYKTGVRLQYYQVVRYRCRDLRIMYIVCT